MKRRLYMSIPHRLVLLLGAMIALSAPRPAHAYDMTAGVIPAAQRTLAAAASSAPEEKPAASEGRHAAPLTAAQNETAAAAEEEEAESVGFPQLKTASYPSQIFWLAVTFILVYTLMSKLCLPRMTAVMADRRQRRDGNLAQAARLQQDAEKVTKTYEEALAEAHDAAQKTLSAAQSVISEKLSAENAKFAEHANNRMAAAEKNIQKARQDVLASLPDLAAEIAGEIVEKVSGVQINKADARKAVTAVQSQEG
jgi:F-type H+-transporting ATPase subunit b